MAVEAAERDEALEHSANIGMDLNSDGQCTHLLVTSTLECHLMYVKSTQ